MSVSGVAALATRGTSRSPPARTPGQGRHGDDAIEYGPYSRRMELDTSRTMEEDGGKQEVPADEIVFSVMNISLKLCNFDNLGLQGDFFVVNRC